MNPILGLHRAPRGWEEGPGEGASLPASSAAREVLGRCWLSRGRAWTVTLQLADPRRPAGRSSPFAAGDIRYRAVIFSLPLSPCGHASYLREEVPLVELQDLRACGSV